MRKIVKKTLINCCDLFDLIDEKIGIMKAAGSENALSNVLKFELVSFLMCLSAADGRISRVEAKLIRDYFDIQVYPIHIKKSIEEHKIGSREYFEKVPECLKLAVKVDNHINFREANVDGSIGELLIELFKILGKEMIVADEKVTLEEQAVWKRYILMMTQYVADTSKYSNLSKAKRPGKPIDVDYENSLKVIGRIYELYRGRL